MARKTRRRTQRRIREFVLDGTGIDEVFPEEYHGNIPRNLFGPRSLAEPIEYYSPSYMTDMFGAGVSEIIHQIDSTNNLPAVELVDVHRSYAKSQHGGDLKERIIFDPGDDRITVADTTSPPWRCICQLQTILSNGSIAYGTGWFAAPNVIVTAGHCLYTQDGLEPIEIIVTPGISRDKTPYHSQSSRVVRVPVRWVENKDDEFDYGMVILPNRQLGNQTGWFGYAVAKDQHLPNMRITSAGYPADHGNDIQISCRGRIKGFNDFFLAHSIDTVVGQSGSPVYHTSSTGIRTVIGIHTDSGKPNQPNKAVRITADIFDDIRTAVVQNA